MLKTLTVAGTVLLAIAIIVPVAIYYSSDTNERKWVPNFPDAKTPARATVPLSLDKVRARLVEKFGVAFEGANSYATVSRPEYGPQFEKFTVLPNEDGNIDGQFRPTENGGMSSDAPISTKHLDLSIQDPGLPAYLELSVPERAHDLQIESRADWTASDVQKQGKPLSYNSDYLIHLKSLAPDETQITILGLNATVIDGERWSVVGDVFFTAPRRVDNVLSVPPSPADKRAMLENIVKLLK